MRTKSSSLNIIANISKIVIQTVLLFVVRIVFVHTLGEDYLGLQGLFTNVISMLSLAELGIGTAICYSLYEPLAKKDNEMISQIMTLYKKVYRFLGIAVTLIGICMIPFIKYFVKSYSNNDLNYIFLIYLFNLTISYLFSYKDILIEADQKNYLIARYNIIAIIITNLLQLFILVQYKNFIAYLLIDFIINGLKRFLINRYITKKYPNINFDCEKKIKSNYLKELLMNIKSLLLFRIGNYLVDGTDNIIISKFINIGTVGIYGNYLSISSIFKNFLNSIISGITSSFGNLIVEEDEKTQENVFNIMNYISFVFISYITVCLINLFNPFIECFYGTKYALPFYMVAIIVFNFYVSGMIYPLDSVKSAAGLYNEDRYIPIIQAVINLVSSIILVKLIGLVGIFIGTTLSYLLLILWNRPYMIYKYIFKSSVKGYYIRYIKEMLITLLSVIISLFVINKLSLSLSIINLIITGIICSLIHIVIILLYSLNRKEFIFLKNISLDKVRRNEK